MPPGWHLASEYESSTYLAEGDRATAEILHSPDDGLPPEELGAREVEDMRHWQGVTEVASQFVQLPAGRARWATFIVSEPVDGGPMRWIFYTLEDEDTQYVFLIRGRGPEYDEFVADAQALVESFVILD